MSEQNFRADCEWFKNENLYLQDMYDEMEEEHVAMEQERFEAVEAYGEYLNKMRNVRQTVVDEFSEDNNRLAGKIVLYSNIIAEYQQLYGVNGPRLNQLMKQGGFIL